MVHGHVTGCVNVIRDGTLPRDENEMTCNFAVVKVSGRCGRAVPVCVCVVKNRRRKKLGLFCYGTGSLQAATSVRHLGTDSSWYLRPLNLNPRLGVYIVYIDYSGIESFSFFSESGGKKFLMVTSSVFISYTLFLSYKKKGENRKKVPGGGDAA